MSKPAIIAVVILILGAGGAAIAVSKMQSPQISENGDGTATTTEGTGGTPTPTPTPTPKPSPTPTPKPTPTPTPKGNEVRVLEGQKQDSVLVEKIYPDRIEGKNFAEYPVASNEGYPLTMRIGDRAGNGCTIWLTLVRIEGKVAIFTREETPDAPCPICLSKGTLIDTPEGAVRVEDLSVGMEVYTLNKSGERIVAPIAKAGHAQVSESHKVVTITLADGRSATMSLNHPLTDGRRAGDLQKGDPLDGSTVTDVTIEPYGEPYTYDLLPEGPTGWYFANGIPLGSTLKK